MSQATGRYPNLFHPVLIAGCLVVMASFAIRASFGLFQIPIAEEFGWLRADFSFAIALQNLFWGISAPLFSAMAEKFGDRKAILAGGVFYAVGLVLSSYAITPGQHQWLEILVGFGISGTGFGIILAVVGRATAPEHRSLAMGIATAAGSAGQVVGPPVVQWLLQGMPWQEVFVVLAGFIMVTMFALLAMKVPPPAPLAQNEENLGQVVRRAVKDPTFIFIFLGFFSCGYQLAFITAHFPAFITEMCGTISPTGMLNALGISTTASLGALSIALIGIFNICGTILAGWLGNKYSRKYLLASIYAMRTVVAAVFILSPITPESVLIFSALMGGLWLATVPLTSGLIAQIYGLRYMGTLYGLVFLSHQIGGFMGVWLGGAMYDIYGDYTFVWWIGVGVGAISALIHLPVDERPWQQRQGLAVA
ncbi:MFS transporter [Maribrevibacterium harenarium]|uniref:MFS transporter n=1 Tax=Maribrevibacterium harenarium TaxID=2589817 RepID=A0A501WSK8_9GAMM|nr:MFS transporter [Maribrevibacterium harenarium]TPE51832.1 MFS transporter [Maribrevibacterium harenarium]